jgi:hypothetical protein
MRSFGRRMGREMLMIRWVVGQVRRVYVHASMITNVQSAELLMRYRGSRSVRGLS